MKKSRLIAETALVCISLMSGAKALAQDQNEGKRLRNPSCSRQRFR
jgi:hypothetical protein